MKEAKIEADQIIAAYRAEMESVYQRTVQQVRSSHSIELTFFF